MDSPISLQDVANIITFLAPGYFAMQVYYLVYAKRDRDFTRIFVESVIYSLPIVAFTNLMWENVLHQPVVQNLNTEYSCLLIFISLLSGAVATLLRVHWPIKQLAARWGFDSPNQDFVKMQLLRIHAADRHKSPVTVTLKGGFVFSGTVDQLSRYSHDGQNFFSFSNLAWYDEATHTWDERKGNIIVSRDEIQFIETPELRSSHSTNGSK